MSITTSVCAVTNITAASLNASALSVAPTSNFTYELITEVISETEIAVTFLSTYNPGISQIALGLTYDANECTFIKPLYDYGLATSMLGKCAVNEEKGICIYAATLLDDTEYTGTVAITFYFEVESTTDPDRALSFSTNVYDYKSDAEDIDVYTKFSEMTEYEESITITHSIPYYLGDADNDEEITLDDVSKILSIASACTSKNEIATVSNINELIDTNAQYDNTSTWASLFNCLIRENYACAEAADANQDGSVQTNDAYDVLDYYSLIGSSQSVEDLLIGTEMFKVFTTTIIV